MSAAATATTDLTPADGNVISINNLTFAYPGRAPVLNGLQLQLGRGARCLLIGANGAGKSTLLRILAGRHLTKPDDAVRILGRSSFHDTKLNFERAYLDTDWGMRTGESGLQMPHADCYAFPLWDLY